MRIPTELTAGDSVTWLDDFTTDNQGNSIDSSWTLNYVLAKGAVRVTLTANSTSSGWSTTLPKTSSDNFTAGTVFWQAYAEKASDRVTIGRGTLTMLASIAEANGSYDGRSQIKQDLDAVTEAIRAIISGGAVAEYSIAGRSLRKLPMTDLIMLQKTLQTDYANELRTEALKNGMPNPSRAFVRFI